MCRLTPWDQPVLRWLERLLPEATCLLDAGGHLGTKYRAFRTHVDLHERLKWVIYDVPAIVRAGREKSIAEGLTALSFVDSLADAPAPEIFLASGLLQYLDTPLEGLISQLPARPRHLILNKVATRKGPTIVTLEYLGRAEVPYQVWNRSAFEDTLASMGYEILDEWEIPELSHVIATNPFQGASSSRGYYARLIDKG